MYPESIGGFLEELGTEHVHRKLGACNKLRKKLPRILEATVSNSHRRLRCTIHAHSIFP